MKTQKGFTLIELLVVIAIIGILSAVVIVAIQDQRDRAKASNLRQYMGELVKAVELYKAGNGDSVDSIEDGASNTGSDSASLETYIGQYVEILPADKLPGFVNNGTIQLLKAPVGASCGQVTDRIEYAFVFESEKSNLDLRPLLDNDTGDQIEGDGTYYYCANSQYK